MMKTPNIKQQAHALIDQLPDDASWDDVLYRIEVRRSIESGLRDLAAGRTYTTEALKRSLGLIK